MTSVWSYVNTAKSVGDPDHLKVCASRDTADAWLAKSDPAGAAFEYDVIEDWPTFEVEDI